LAGLGAGQIAQAMHPHVSFVELAQTADAIFVGRVTQVESRWTAGGAAIVTDVTFAVDRSVHQTEAARGRMDEAVKLTFAGGRVGDQGLSVSGVPEFQVGEEYVVFTRLDGGIYMNPLVGGIQGLFAVRHDDATQRAYPTTPAGRGLLRVEAGELRYSEPVEAIAGGRAQFAAPTITPAALPRSAHADDTVSSDAAQRADEASALMDLDAFVAEIEAALAAPPVAEPALRGVRPGEPRDVGGRDPGKKPSAQPGSRSSSDGLVPEPFDWQPPEDPGAPVGHVCALAPIFDPKVLAAEGTIPGEEVEAAGPRAALCYCGAFNLFLTMEQVPTTWWEWGENNDAMYYYNQFMDIYRYVPDDGTFGSNSQNEFGGYPSSQTLMNIYGGNGWNGDLAVTWTFWTSCACCTITQADVFFNPAYSWWQNLADTLDQPARALYRPVLYHELGHTWGMQRGSCTEDYSYGQISVMHAYYSNIIEDGYGLHHPEVYSIRRLYSSQRPILNRKDIGVESYYASGSLQNTTTGSTFYYIGDSITIQNITVENNSNVATAGVRLRFFLSSNNLISTGDYQMGSYWYWDSFPAETYSTASYTTTVPNVPPGVYYVGAIVTTDGAAYNGDDFGFNNATYLKSTITVAHPPPANNWCSNAIPIGVGTVYGTTLGASTDGSSACGSGTPDVWYAFTAPCTGTLRVDSCGSSYDTIVSLHSECTGWSGNDLGCDDDCEGTPCGPYSSCFTASVTAGTSYRIRVSGWNGNTGNFALTLSYISAGNDSCGGALTVGDGTTSFSTCAATTDGPADCGAYSDVWFGYTSTCEGYFTASLCGSAYDTYMGIYADGACPPAWGSVLACDDDSTECGYQTILSVPTTIGSTYLIRVGGYFGATGEGQLTITCGGCLEDGECDDGLACNGAEFCLEGGCLPGEELCPGQWCDEASAGCYEYGDGDADGDGDVDLFDYAVLQRCVGAYAIPFCAGVNLIGDGYIDLDDFAAWEPGMTGP
jgi:hypothetical protein